MNKKSQAAVEFLTTYGWALMAILISIGVLSYFDFLSADRYISQYCETGSQLECLEGYIEQDGAFRLNLRNNFPVDVEIDYIEVEIDGIGTDLGIKGNGINLIPRGSTAIVGFNNINSDVNLNLNSKKEMIIKIGFNRKNGTNTYEVVGRSILQVSQQLCGNGDVDPGEQCDVFAASTAIQCTDDIFNDEYSSGNAGCSNSCTYDVTSCS